MFSQNIPDIIWRTISENTSEILNCFAYPALLTLQQQSFRFLLSILQKEAHTGILKQKILSNHFRSLTCPGYQFSDVKVVYKNMRRREFETSLPRKWTLVELGRDALARKSEERRLPPWRSAGWLKFRRGNSKQAALSPAAAATNSHAFIAILRRHKSLPSQIRQAGRDNGIKLQWKKSWKPQH